VLVPRQGSKVMVAFIDQGMFMDSDLRKKYYNDPIKIAELKNFRRAKPIIYGMLITEVLAQPATLLGAFVDDDQKERFFKFPYKVPAYILGRNLTGAQISLENKPGDIDVEMAGLAEGNRLGFFIESSKPISNNITLHLLVRKGGEIYRTSLPVGYTIPATTLDEIKEKIKPGDAVEVMLTGSNYFKGITKAAIDGKGIEIIDPQEVQDDGKTLKLKLKVTKDAIGPHDVTVHNGQGIPSVIRTLTVE
jgi:hypothetical protein